MARVSQYQNASYRVGVGEATVIAGRLLNTWSLREQMEHALSLYAASIMPEIELFSTIRESDSISHAQSAIIFAILSPQCRFDKNVRAASRFSAVLYEPYDSVDDVYQAITDNGSDSWVTAGMGARNIFHSLDFIRNVSDGDMEKDVIMALRKAGKIKGLGHKTTSMALALYNANFPVYTLDVHMLRGILSACGMEDCQAGSMYITDAAYPILESALVILHGEVCPELPVFASQWALWALWRGEFDSHAGIFV